MYSSCKSHTTYKGNVNISPSGEIIHIISLFKGSISSKELVRQSGLLPLLQPRDQIMADKGFVIQDLLTPLGCSVVMPSFLSSKQQFSKGELQNSKKIHNLQVRVERAIRRVKEFHANIGQYFAAIGCYKTPGNVELRQIRQGHLNRAFSEILQRGDQRKLVQKLGRLKGLEKHLGANVTIL